MSAKKPKIEIKGLFVLRYVKDENAHGGDMYDIAIITPDDKYVEYELVVSQKALTHWVLRRFAELFRPYRFTEMSQVYMSEYIGTDDPFYMYLKILQQYIGFTANIITVRKIFGRLNNMYPTMLRTKSGVKDRHDFKTITNPMSYLQRFWRGILDRGICPWITQKYDDYIKSRSAVKRCRKQFLRIGLFYCVVRSVRMKSDYKWKNKKLLEKQN